MKKVFLFLVALIPFVGIHAQDFHFSPRLGMSLSNLTGAEGNMKPGVNVGFAVEIPLAELFSIEPGVYYSMQGSKTDNGSMTLNMDYINIPIHAKYYIYEGLHLIAGPQFAFNVNSKFKSDAPTLSDDIDIKKVVNTFDFGINLGLGYQFPIGLNVGLQYNLGVTKVFEDSGLRIEEKDIVFDNCNNRVLQINLGWRF